MKEQVGSKYFRNTKTGNSRTIRVEVIGEVSPQEKDFLDGISYMVAGVMSKCDPKHTVYVSELLGRLASHIVKKMRDDRLKGR